MIIHVDMDAFYASVEMLDNPQLKGKCVIVGGTSNRGVVSAASYEARRHGVHSAMPVFQAKRLCPQGVFIPPRMSRYKTVSRGIMAILKTFSPLVEIVSIDEAYLDVQGSLQIMGTSREIAGNIKQKIRAQTGLTCSVGMAPVRFLAKIASDLEKPDGLTIIYPAEVPEFIETLAIQKVPGIGKKSTQALHRLGIRYLGDVRRYPREMLEKRLGKWGRRLINLSKGIDPTPVSPERDHKSVSAEQTLAANTMDTHFLKQIMLQQSQRVSKQLRKMGVRAKVITLKLKHDDFKQVTRRTTISVPTHSTETIFHEAVGLLEQYQLTQKVRLVGVGASGFISSSQPIQMDIFDAAPRRNRNWEKVDQTLDHISRKFGKKLVDRASLTVEPKKDPKN